MNQESTTWPERHLIEALADAELRAIDLCGGYRELVSVVLDENRKLQQMVDRQNAVIRGHIFGER